MAECAIAAVWLVQPASASARMAAASFTAEPILRRLRPKPTGLRVAWGSVRSSCRSIRQAPRTGTAWVERKHLVLRRSCNRSRQSSCGSFRCRTCVSKCRPATTRTRRRRWLPLNSVRRSLAAPRCSRRFLQSAP